MDELTPTPDYMICGIVAPQAHRFSLGGREYHIHRLVYANGTLPKRYDNIWQLSVAGVPISQKKAMSLEAAAKLFISLIAAYEDSMGISHYEIDLKNIIAHNRGFMIIK